MKRFLSLIVLTFTLFLDVSPLSATAATVGNVSVSAQASVLMISDTGEVISSQNADLRLPMASTTKIMTAIIALENLTPDTVVSVSPKACGIEGSSAYLYENEKISVETLLYAVMLQSANDAAAALAIETAGSIEAFAELMNGKAKELGLENTHFTNPHGLDDEGHYSSAYDLACIMAYAMKNEDFRKITATYKYTAKMQGRDETRLFVNHNKLLKSCDGCIGGKTGFTKKCGRCLVSVCERKGIELIAVTLNAPDDWNDHKNLFEFGYNSYEKVILCENNAYTFSIPVINGEKDTVNAATASLVKILKKEDALHITTVCELDRFYYADVKKGDILGELVFCGNGKELGRTPIIAKQSVKAIRYKSWWQKLLSIFIKDV